MLNRNNSLLLRRKYVSAVLPTSFSKSPIYQSYSVAKCVMTLLHCNMLAMTVFAPMIIFEVLFAEKLVRN